MLAATSLVVFMILYKLSWGLLLLFFGAATVLTALSWAPGLLLKPTVATSPRDMETVEIPKIASSFLALGAYCLLAGAILAWIFRSAF
jgi:hypothetical protein